MSHTASDIPAVVDEFREWRQWLCDRPKEEFGPSTTGDQRTTGRERRSTTQNGNYLGHSQFAFQDTCSPVKKVDLVVHFA